MRQNTDTKKKNRGKTACKVFAVTLAVLLALAGITAAGIAANRRFINRIAPLSYETQVHPKKTRRGAGCLRRTATSKFYSCPTFISAAAF